jgi:hypothetical protein
MEEVKTNYLREGEGTRTMAGEIVVSVGLSKSDTSKKTSIWFASL